MPNDEEQDEAGQDQRQRNDDGHASLSWLRTASADTTFQLAFFGRWARAGLSSSPFDTPLQTDAARRLDRTACSPA